MATSLVVIDSRVANYNAVIASLAADTGYVVLDRERDGVVQVMEALAGKSGYSSIQIISHGAPGSITLGSTMLDSAALHGYSEMLATIGCALLPTGDLLLYGCNVGAGDVGQHFVAMLAELTGADVAASDDLTGSAAFGGDWELEVQSGTIESVIQQIVGIDGVLENSAPTLTAFAAPVDSVAEDTTVEITLDELKAQGNEADTDGTVDAFVVKAVSSGSLKIGANATSATVWNMASNATIDATHNAWWTPSANANGTLNAFTVVAKDNSGAESATAVQAMVTVSSVNDAPTFLVGDGKATSVIGLSNDVAESVAIQNDGKILVGGWSSTGSYSDMAIVRYNANGTIDLPFGAGGRISAIVGSESYLKTILVQNDGKILVAGNNTGDILVDRFNADGSLDNSFDGDGMVITPIGSGVDACNRALVQSDGKILVAGYTMNGSYKDSVLVRYTTAGALDTSFNSTGKLTVSTGTNDDEFTGVAVQSDGNIIAVGYCNNGISKDIVVTRYTTTGALDTTFGNGGKTITAIGAYNDVGQTVAIQNDGNILVAGWSFNGDYNDGVIVRYNSTGVLDSSFGNNGIVTVNVAAGDDMIRNMALQRDGKILVTLWSDNFSSQNFVLARYNSNGTLDNSFDGDGIVTTDIGVGDDVSNSVTVQSDGKIVVVGKSSNGSNDDAVVRYNGDGSLDTTFDPLNTLSSKSTYTEGGAAVVLGSDIKIFDADLAALGNYGGATLTLARHGGASADDRFSGDGIVAGSASGTVTVAGTAIGSYTWSSGTLTISFTTQATQTLVNQAMDALAWQNINTAPPATVQLDWTFSDGNSTGTQGSGGVLGTTGYKTVNITAVTQAPTLTAFSGAVATTNEDTLGTITFADLVAKGNEADADGSVTAFVIKELSSSTFNLKIGADAATAIPYDSVLNNVIDATQSAYWMPVGNTNGILNAFTVVARDNEHATSATAVQVTVNTVAVNDAPTFYVGNGIITTDFGGDDAISGIVAQDDGKIIVAGRANNDFALIRYNSDGFLDTSFDSDGKVLTDFNLSTDNVGGVVVQSDGKIVVVGSNGSDVALMRYKSNGALDTTFDSDGKVNTSINSGVESANSVALQSNGKIVVAGYSTNSSGYKDALLIRYNKDGSLDNTFDGDGVVTTTLSIKNDEFRSVVLQADGKILAAGISYNGSNNDIALVRYNSDGSIDTTFGAGGVITTAIGTDDQANSVIIQQDGKILVGGHNGSNYSLIRYNSDGSLDTTFDTDGIVVTSPDGGFDTIFSLTLQPDGKIVAAGYSQGYWKGGTYHGYFHYSGYYDFLNNFSFVRYNTNGTLDTTFDGDGIVITDLGDAQYISKITVQSDGKILAGGDSNGNFALVRYNTDGSIDTTFNQTTNTLNGAPAYTENGTPVVLDSDVQIVDSEANAKGTYGDATLTLERHGGSNVEDLFSGAGIVAGSASGNVVVSTTNIGSYTWANGKLLVTFNVQATPTLVNQAMSALAYSNSSDTPSSSAQIDWTFNDGDSTGALSTTGSTTVTITAVNDAPTLTAFAAPVAKGADNQQCEITLNALLAQGDEVDVDGTVTAFVVKEISTGTLTLGTSASSATAWNATTNYLIDNTHQAYWKPATGANGDLSAFTVVARDNNGATSATNVQTIVHIGSSPNPIITLSSSTPADNATNVTVGSNIVLTLSDAIQAGSGNIIITDGTDTRPIAVTDSSQITINGSTVTINPTADLQAGNHYHLEIASGVIKDLAGNPYPGMSNPTTLDFTTNALPTLTTFGAVVDSTYLNTTDEVTYADLAAQGNEADSDGTVTAFIVKSLSTGVLNIGGNIATATAWNATTNNTIDATHHAYWTPATDATGDLNAFTVVAKDNSGVESIIPVQAKVQVKESSALFCDDFSNPLSSTVWDYNHWQATNNPSYYGRTQQRQSLPEVSDGYLHLKLDTYNPTGYSFFGSEAITKQTFSNANGCIVFEVKAHFENPVAGGIVGGMFLYSPNSGSIHGEIDFEAVSNRLNEIQTNIYANEALGAGHPEFDAITGSLTDDHVYRAEWYQDTVLWFVDGKLIREEKTYIPTQPMALHFNIWAPGQEWPEGYNSELNPVNSAAANTAYDFDIDSVCVTQLSSTHYYGDPVLTSSTPSDDATAVAIDSNIVLTFSEVVQAGTGNIIISDGTDDTRTITITDSSQVTFDGSLVTINPTNDLQTGTLYNVKIDNGAITDDAGNAFAGISESETLNFETEHNALSGHITFWKTGSSITDVTTTLTTLATNGTHTIELKNIHITADGSHTIEVWATMPNSTTGSMELEFALPTGSSATWQDAAKLPAGWTSAANTIATSGHLLVGGMSINPLPEGQVKLGTLTITSPTNPDNFELLLVGGQLGDNDVEGFGISSISSNTGSGNEYSYHLLSGDYVLTADKLAGEQEASAVHANDALAALKMALEINPNNDGSTLLPYQFLAADINQDGKVRANDALNILKMAVGIETAPDDKWIFVSEEEALAATMSRKAVDWSVADIDVHLNADTQLDLIGIVKGDVDGSWVGVG